LLRVDSAGGARCARGLVERGVEGANGARGARALETVVGEKPRPAQAVKLRHPSLCQPRAVTHARHQHHRLLWAVRVDGARRARLVANVALEGAGGARRARRRVQKEARGAQALRQPHARQRRRVGVHGARRACRVAERGLVAPQRARRARGRAIRVPRLARALEHARRVGGVRHARVCGAGGTRDRSLVEE